MLSKDKIDVLLEKHAGDTDGFLAAYTTEVRKQDTELIRQMKDALEDGHDFAGECIARFSEAMQGHRQDELKRMEQEAENIANAIHAACTRLRLENT